MALHEAAQRSEKPRRYGSSASSASRSQQTLGRSAQLHRSSHHWPFQPQELRTRQESPALLLLFRPTHTSTHTDMHTRAPQHPYRLSARPSSGKRYLSVITTLTDSASPPTSPQERSAAPSPVLPAPAYHCRRHYSRPALPSARTTTTKEARSMKMRAHGMKPVMAGEARSREWPGGSIPSSCSQTPNLRARPWQSESESESEAGN